MILYRIHENLLYGDNSRIPKGAIHSLGKLSDEAIGILIKKDRISMYRAPPLEALPGFKYRAKRLSKFGLGTVDLFSLSSKDIMSRTGLSEKLVEKWKRELYDVLGIKEDVYKKDG